ncbi:class C beta-lactamase-related serine hydrolase [Burkholderia sp. Bp8963]|uniref:serine hydrolase domain-containing protein n=1 Tax=Burkholderia sp. Bp8963 TaxID=2184547 RepID=UPI000F5B550C|nr:serine hydrolase [Burkholderia sp. Bp8963]RQS64111.1 class C beta-lactamase-related serine hydrolase [Burkholderia sp. Bp8963]
MPKKRLLLICAALAVSFAGCTAVRPDYAARVATGTTAHDVCSETFVSGQQPDDIFAETLASRPGFGWIAPLIRYRVDRGRREVSASLAGAFTSRAVYRGAWGCMLVKSDAASIAPPQPLPAVSDTPLPVAQDPSPAMSRALDAAFAESDPRAPRRTKAVAVLYRGELIGERYAPGYGPDTPILGFSISKSVTNALVGVLVREGKLRVDMPVPLDNGSGASIPLEDFMRMTSGLDIDETGSGFDPSNQVMYVHTDDMAAATRRTRAITAPGQRWAYSSASVHLVARIVRDAVGGNAATVQRFAHDALFAPLGMQHVTMEMDETGTPIGAHYMLASTRDWARFGALYLNDGVAPDGRRLLPQNWVRWSTTPTLATDYGAGWWVNHHDRASDKPVGDMPLMPDAPADTFYALGNLGQYVIVVPSKQLVIVRLGNAQTHDFDIDGANRLVKDVIDALPGAAS